MFLVDVHGNKRCPKCEGFIIPMEHPDEQKGVYCRNCGRNWYYNQVSGKEMDGYRRLRDVHLPSTGKDVYTTNDRAPS